MKHILICDDEPFIRDIIASHLTLTGYDVKEAQDGQDCVDQMKGEMPDAVLLDLNMPGMDGISALKKIRELGFDCPVIVITASTEPSKISMVRSFGALGILTKPFNMKNMHQSLEALAPEIFTNSKWDTPN